MRALPLPARRERFRVLYEANYARILGYALRRCPDPEDAADVVSETFLTAWRRLDAVPPEEARLWLYGTARRVLANQRRGRRRRRQLGERLREDLGQAASPAPEREGRLGDVACAFACLSDGDREILALAAWEDLGAAELGRVIGCSENAARIRLHRARRSRRRISRTGSSQARFPPPSAPFTCSRRRPLRTVPPPGSFATS
jgi:RNA polymerase sigma factor (sigma-70 family)